jgi:hypothetical protein
LSIDLQNTAHTRCDAKARIVRRSAIGNKLGGINVWKKPSAREWLIRSGKLRPLTNLTTGKKYASLSEAARNETHDDRPGIKRACDTGRPTLSGTSYAWLSLDGEPQLTEGHRKNLPRTRRVKDVLTGKVYESAGTAARGLGVSLSSVQGTCAGKYKTCQGTLLCYLDDDGNEQLTATHTQYRKEREEAARFAFAAYRIEDVAFEKPLRFDSIKELAATLGIPLSHIPAVIKGERRQVKGYRVARWDKLKSEPKLTESHMKPVMLKGRHVICLDDQRRFPSPAAAARHYQLEAQQIVLCCRGVLKTTGRSSQRRRFAYADKDGNPLLTQKHSESLAMRKTRIFCPQLGREFQNIAEFSRETGVPAKRARKHLFDPSVDLAGLELVRLK